MATIDTSSMASEVRGRIQRTETYAEQVRRMFAAVVNTILSLRVTPPNIRNGEMFSFDSQNIRIRQQVEQLLRQLHSVVVLAIEKGISLEWEKAQEASDALLQRVYGSRLLNSNVFCGWNSRNQAAQEEFIKRSDRGMNLSQRVWKSCRQLRDEMEIALTVSIGEGEDAGTISRRVRQYLNDPDLMFRRFRYKIKEPLRDDKGNYILDKNGQIQMIDKLDSAGNPVWGRKWKKKVIGADGRVTFIDYDKDSYHDQWTGRGYYKSAAQNAMRVARTETNIAYRRADCERWKQLDFVLGFRVELSHNHPEYDICDELKGDYPKDFVFDGWHPQCFCHAVPILIEPEEMRKRNEAIARGEEYTPKGTPITDVPQGFKKWCIKNQEKIHASRQRGSEPYFVHNNLSIIDEIINPQDYKRVLASDINDVVLNPTPLEVYCNQHYTEKFTICSQETYDEVMIEMGKVSKPLWQVASEEVKEAFVDYCAFDSTDVLNDLGAGKPNEIADKMETIMSRSFYPKDIVLRSGQDFIMAQYIFNENFMELLKKGNLEELNKKYAGTIGKNIAYMSASFNEKGGFEKEFELHIFCPKGTPMFNVFVLSPAGVGELTNWDGVSYPPKWDPEEESEILLGKNLLYKFVRAETGTGLKGKNRVYIQIVGRI